MKSRKKAENRTLTPRKLEVLTAIRDWSRSNGFSPTMQELADQLNISKVTVFEHVNTLVKKGLLRRMPHKARSLEVTSLARFPDDRTTLVPLAGRIAAGQPIEAIEDSEVLDLEGVFAARRGSEASNFALQVSGDSMVDDQIADGDYVIIEPRKTPKNGEVVVALLENGEATLKRFYREKQKIRLQPANDAYEPIYVDQVDIQGVVVGVVRRYR
ncbi:MAG: transcriptional repressor LexA [Phycisphaerae bacterium]|nr:transcriptional repressor LexA [Phycisphaerae bacterium]